MSNTILQAAIAKAIATIAHKGQIDKAGNPYIDHPARVAAKLSVDGESDIVVAAGWLHDVLEDTDITREDLIAAGVKSDVIYYVERVTRDEGQSIEDYYDGIKNGGVGAFRVKRADIADNSDPSRLALLDDATIARLVRKYAKARLLLGIAA